MTSYDHIKNQKGVPYRHVGPYLNCVADSCTRVGEFKVGNLGLMVSFKLAPTDSIYFHRSENKGRLFEPKIGIIGDYVPDSCTRPAVFRVSEFKSVIQIILSD